MFSYNVNLYKNLNNLFILKKICFLIYKYINTHIMQYMYYVDIIIYNCKITITLYYIIVCVYTYILLLEHWETKTKKT